MHNVKQKRLLKLTLNLLNITLNYYRLRKQFNGEHVVTLFKTKNNNYVWFLAINHLILIIKIIIERNTEGF